MRYLVAMTALAALLLASPGQASGSCRDYQLIDNDSGERVEGCVPERVEASGGKPIQVAPALDKTVRFGWRIAELPRGDLFARMGLRPGDVILTLNGFDMASQATPNKIAEVLGGTDKLVITVGSKPRIQPTGGTTQVIEVTKGAKGLTLNTVEPNSFFASIGVKPGDTVLSIAGQPVTDLASLTRLESQAKNMDEVHVIIKRGSEELDLLIKSQ